MAVEDIRDDSLDTLVCRITVDPNSNGNSFAKDLGTALDIIMASGDGDDYFYRAIDVTGKWTAGQSPFEAWDEANVAAWTKIVDDESVHEPLAAWLDRVEQFAARYFKEEREGIHESEEAQLGEVPATLLALKSVRFVPLFTRFLKAWDLHSGSLQPLHCIEIVENHGITPETEEMLFTIGSLTKDSLVILRLREVLDAHYGDFETSDLARAWG